VQVVDKAEQTMTKVKATTRAVADVEAQAVNKTADQVHIQDKVEAVNQALVILAVVAVVAGTTVAAEPAKAAQVLLLSNINALIDN
jgi:hypothetical protein